MKVVFLDIDGVLNSQSYFVKNHKNNPFSEINMNKLLILKKLIKETNSFIVIISSWRIIKSKYKELENIFFENGLSILGKTEYLRGKRGNEIKKYLSENDNIDSFIIIDDDIFDDYDEYLLSHLVKTSFYEDGLEIKHLEDAKKILTRKIK